MLKSLNRYTHPTQISPTHPYPLPFWCEPSWTCALGSCTACAFCTGGQLHLMHVQPAHIHTHMHPSVLKWLQNPCEHLPSKWHHHWSQQPVSVAALAQWGSQGHGLLIQHYSHSLSITPHMSLSDR